MEQLDTLTPISESSSYSVEFQKKGYVLFYQNGVLESRFRIVFKHFLEAPEPFDFQSIIYLDNDKENRIGLQVSTDTLSLGSFPFDVKEGCGYAANRFIRE